MKNARIAWDDNNADELGHRIYRSLSPMDTADMPPAHAELGPDVTEWTDTDTPQDAEVYYRVSAFTATEEAFSEEVLVDTYTPVEFVGATFSGYVNGVTSVSAMAPPETQVGDLIVGIAGHRSALTGEVADWAVEATNIEATGLQQQSVMTRYADRAGEHQVGVAQVAPERMWLGVLIFRARGRTAAVGAVQTGLSTPTSGAGTNVLPVQPVINLPGSDAPFVVSAVSSKLALTESGTVLRPIAEAFRVLATGSDSATNHARFAVGVIQRPPSDALGVAFEMTTFVSPTPDSVVGHTFEIVARPGYKVFTSDGDFIAPEGVTEVDVLVVAGGGGGGSRQGGGGGAGGLQVFRVAVTPGEVIPVVVGAGGSGGTNGGRGQNGQNSSFGTFSTLGGGGGGGRSLDNRGADGGSGGGSAKTSTVGAGAGADGQGRNGGQASTAHHDVNAAGGGGGASAQGDAGTGADASGRGGNGGAGYLFSDLSALGLGDDGWFGGGGGGGVWETLAVPGQGGLGGGGSGTGNGVGTPAPGSSGLPNTGGGGGGSNATGTPGGSGGSGIVVVCFPVGGLNPSLPAPSISALRALTVIL